MSQFIDLERLLASERDAALEQVLRDGETVTWGQWRARVDCWRAFLNQRPGRTWALYHSDAGEFAAILFALWACERVACVPGSNQPGVVANLADRVDGFVGEFADTGERPYFSEPSPVPGPVPPPGALDSDERVLEVFTSGSSGQPQAIPKRLGQLSAEVANLEALWVPLAQGAVTMATVSHQHIYGLLFRVLWPLAAGRCFDARQCEYFQQISDRGRDRERLLVISSPAHLSRLPREMNCEILLNRCRAIFSSGAPLPRESGLRVRELLGFSPLEVYGSSETGGIAWRAQTPDTEPPWRPFPGVEVSVDPTGECLRVRSPYLPPMPAGAWHTTSDRASLEGDGGFRLHGRVDRIVKIEGKRVSLDEMEQRLIGHEWIQVARLVLLSGRRTEIGAVVVATQAGARHLNEAGRRRMNIEFQKHLHERFERTVIPRRWRYVDVLPVNSQGKTTRQALLSLFDGKAGGDDAPADTMDRVVNR